MQAIAATIPSRIFIVVRRLPISESNLQTLQIDVLVPGEVKSQEVSRRVWCVAVVVVFLFYQNGTMTWQF